LVLLKHAWFAKVHSILIKFHSRIEKNKREIGRIAKKTARIIFKMIQSEMVLLHGFIKKTQKTPLEDLQLAKKRAKKYEVMEGKAHGKQT
jgi:phage-related protein